MRSNKELKYHYHPEKGWINDPNGLVFFKGYYHLFYQHQPLFEQPGKGPMVWGHAITKDFLHFEELPVALDADRPYDKDGVWSGTAIEKDGVLYLFYASVSDGKQTISLAKSFDGVNFIKYEKNPIIRDYPKDGSVDFRDPAVYSENGVNYLMVASADTLKKTGNILLFRSKTLPIGNTTAYSVNTKTQNIASVRRSLSVGTVISLEFLFVRLTHRIILKLFTAISTEKSSKRRWFRIFKKDRTNMRGKSFTHPTEEIL